MNIVKEIEFNVSLFVSEKYIERLITVLKSKAPMIKKVKKYFLTTPIEVSTLSVSPKKKNLWKIIAENIINFKENFNDEFSEKFIKKYIGYKSKKILNALSMIELKYKINKDILIDIYIYLCKKYIKNFAKLFSSKIDEKKKLVAKTKNIDIKNKSITLSYKGILTKDEVFCKQGFTDIFFDIINKAFEDGTVM